VSGLPCDRFCFEGFLPRRGGERRRRLSALAADPRTVVFFEAPHRIGPTLQELLAVAGDRTLGIGRELTKAHEELVVCPISEALRRFSEPRGEFTVLLPPAPPTTEALPTPTAAQLTTELGELTSSGVGSKRQALKLLAERHGLTVNALYRILQQAS